MAVEEGGSARRVAVSFDGARRRVPDGQLLQCQDGYDEKGDTDLDVRWSNCHLPIFCRDKAGGLERTELLPPC
jgi:hypothetical protein